MCEIIIFRDFVFYLHTVKKGVDLTREAILMKKLIFKSRLNHGIKILMHLKIEKNLLL